MIEHAEERTDGAIHHLALFGVIHVVFNPVYERLQCPSVESHIFEDVYS